ncbi:hypothetical protein ACRJ4B_15930 [Streptomyces sp. GTA36]
MSTADDFVFSTLIAHHPDPAVASRALAMAEAAVLRRAADAINALPQDYECDPGWGDAAERLRRTADGIEGKSSRPAADATPNLTPRQARLLDAIRTYGGQWNTCRVLALYALTDPSVVHRGTARRDLEVLHRTGHLVLVDEPDNRHYILSTRKDDRS